ncbi:la-related protein 6A-like [Nicotiana tabacum]|uniref:La-related protein 6A-like n=2 Tax=Nicotiana TaxID=4085 RepID=A0A1S3YY83_TOBAC|nr:PREDICTED: la-related protein 6A isoform X1 [Nicotiana sylvestris]XP_016457040.1 PREDICTED: la-related protein 6A-like [Nicotiana tabacum]
MEADGEGVVPVPSHSHSVSSPPHDDDHPDFSPVGSPESHFIDDLSQPSDQHHAQVTATLLTDDLRNKIVKQVEYYFSDENLPTDKFLLKYVTRDKEGFVPVKVIASFRKVKKLTKDTAIIAAALKESSLLVVSSDGRKVKRLHPLPLSEIIDPKVCTVLVENLPEDHSVDNLRRIFGQAGNVKHITVRDPHTERDSRKCTTAEKLLSGKLHALVEYNTVEAAEKAVAILNDEQDWRFGLRVKLLKKTNKPGQNKKGWRDPDSDRNMNIQASGQAVNEEYHSSEHRVLQNKPGQSKKGRSDPDSDRNTTIQASDLAVNEEHHSNEHHVDSPDEEEGDHRSKETVGEHAQKEKNEHRVQTRNRGRGRRNKRGTNGHGHGTTSYNHAVEPSKPPPGPRMPDGTRGFAMGRGRPVSSSPS